MTENKKPTAGGLSAKKDECVLEASGTTLRYDATTKALDIQPEGSDELIKKWLAYVAAKSALTQITVEGPAESTKPLLARNGFVQRENSQTWIAPVTQTDPRLTGTPERVALWFYADGFPRDFVLFQAAYLNHALIRFVVQSRWYPSFSEWRKPDWKEDDDYTFTALEKDESYRASGELPSFPKTGSMCGIAASLGSDVSAATPPDEKSLTRYFAEVYTAAYAMLEDSNLTYMNDGKSRVVSPSDESAAIMRFGGSLLLRGRVGDREVIFCYGASQKFELPAVSCEFLAGEMPSSGIEYTPRDRGEARKWHCDRIVWMDEGTYRQAHRFRANPHVFRWKGGYGLRSGDPLDKGVFLQNWTDLERVLGIGALPCKFVDALASLHLVSPPAST